MVYRITLANADTCTLPIETLSRAQFEAIYEASMYYFYRDREDVYAMVNLAGLEPQGRQAEFGVVSLAKRHGHAGDACFALFRFAFRSMGLNRLWCRVNEDNVGCLALIAKHAALTKEGTLRQVRFKNGRFYDQHLFSVLAREVEKWGR